jgi:hypothetical protein
VSGLWWNGEQFVEVEYQGHWEPKHRDPNALIMSGGPVDHRYYMFHTALLPQRFYPARGADIEYLLDTDTAIERTSLVDGKKSWYGVYRWAGDDD